jgi:thiosulfate dehydrogenase
MKKRHLLLSAALAVFLVTVYAGSHRPSVGVSVPADDPLSRGGRLYDKWWAELRLPEPTDTHPAYPASGAKRGSDTWRCKECHGWDYRGRDGAYRKGSHFTGIKGIRDYDGGDPAAVLRILTDDTHRYQQVMGPRALELIAGFVVQGQIDMARHIDPQSGEVSGADLRHGRELFNHNCARCHEEDGRYQNFSGDPADPEYVGTVAKSNPWEAWHKIRNGHPGSQMPMGPAMMGRWRHNEAMPPFRSLHATDQLAILAYARTLPAK